MRGWHKSWRCIIRSKVAALARSSLITMKRYQTRKRKKNDDLLIINIY